MYIEINHVTKAFASSGKCPYKALDDLSLSIDKGEFVCLLGFSGCGKSTLLNLLAGFIRPTSGTVTIDSEQVSHPSQRYVTIFQQYGLLPWRNVLSNVELGLEETCHSREARTDIARKYIRLVGLENQELSYPCQLSGGQMQRVAIARSLAVSPDILFMDEPFGALDPIIRSKLQEDLLKIVKETGMTVVFVTHDIDEAVYLSDRIVVMSANPGRVKTIIPDKLSRPRIRNSSVFSEIRNHVYSELFSLSQNSIEYFI